MEKTLAEIAKIVDGKVVGDENILITGLSGIKEAKEGDLTFVANPKYFSFVRQTKASAIVASSDLKCDDTPIIQAKNPSLAFAQIASHFYGDSKSRLDGIHPSAVVSDKAQIDPLVGIGPCVVVEEGVVIKKGSSIHAGTFLGKNSKIGENTIIYPNVSVMHETTIGCNVIIHSGTVIGSDGFGFDMSMGNQKIPQIGTVVIQDDVEIGANVTIDRARFDRTVIGRASKIDNLVQVGHNVIMGEQCIIVSQVGISGSVELGKGAVLAGQVGVVGHIRIGDGAIAASRSQVTKSIPDGVKVLGSPAKEYGASSKINAHIQRLPKYVEQIKDLTNKVQELEKKLKDG